MKQTNRWFCVFSRHRRVTYGPRREVHITLYRQGPYNYNDDPKQWGTTFMRTRFYLELSCDLDDEEQIKTMEDVLRQGGKDLFAMAVLLCQRRAPVMQMRTENSLIGEHKLELENNG